MIKNLIACLLVFSLVISVPVFAQEINSPAVNATVNKQPESANPVITSAPEVQSSLHNLKVNSSEIFSPVFSEITNLKVNATLENKKVVYQLELPVDTPVYRDKEVVQPVFDLRVDKPVEFRIVDNRIIVNDEQIIDYKEIVREKEVMPPVQTEVQSAVNLKIYDLTVVPEINSALFKFIYREKEVQMPVYSDFKIENKKLYLIHNNKPFDLRVTPPEIYSAVYSAVEKNPEVLVKSLELKVEDEKPIYDLRVEEPFKLFWLIPMKVESRYVINPDDGVVTKKVNPWFAFLGGLTTPIDTYNVT